MLIATVGASVSSVNTTGVLVPVLPAASVSWATMEWAPSPDSVTVVVHSPARADGRGADLGGDAANGVEQRHGGADRGLAGAGGDRSGNRLGRDVGGLRGGC